MNFTKMHGISNDYVYIDCTQQMPENPAELAVRLSDRRTGIGGDGVILICASDRADFFMDMYNADGSRGRMCGNGIRCVAKFVHDKGLTDKTELSIDTLSGVKYMSLTLDEEGKTSAVRVDMGEPLLAPQEIPVLLEGESVIARETDIEGRKYKITCVSMGNPHCVVFLDCKDTPLYELNLESVGPLFENNAIFPQQVNTEFVTVSGDELNMRVWERGSGETWACGTGACAVLVAAVLCGKIGSRSTTVHLRGGDLFIEWSAENNHVYMTGPAEFVFDGHID